MTAPKYTVGIQNVPPKTLVGNMENYWAPPTPLDNADLNLIISGGTIEVLSSNKVLAPEDSGKIFRVDANTAYTVTVASSLPAGFNVAIAQWGNAAITIASGSGANNRSSTTATSAQYKMASIIVLKNNVGLTSAEYLVGEL